MHLRSFKMLTGLDSVTPFLKTSPEETQRQWKRIYKITAALFQIVENNAKKNILMYTMQASENHASTKNHIIKYISWHVKIFSEYEKRKSRV